MFPGDRVTLLEWHWVKEGDWEKKKKKLVPREGGCVGGSCDGWVLEITWRVFRPSGIEEKQWTKLREEAMLQFHQGHTLCGTYRVQDDNGVGAWRL